MAFMEKDLLVKKSTIPGAGKGLFTKKFIPKGKRIVEYKGKISTWKDVDHHDGLNAYIYYVNRYHVIDSSNNKKNLARYANDAKGSQNGIKLMNNCHFVIEENRVFLESRRDIPPNSELLVAYGKEYWDILTFNKNQAALEKKKTAKVHTQV
ncbi:SET domain-containing protein [Ginsengibacter hankyongi]|uniref:SET domain-containing protein n=1 Tax=Ginsengibacter hankyongi TaxID=2607284 RepID=A0A5J5IMG2_9BACT|nr:SET domain-containing protein-lysine N-methyltransferase [Ginsengibacter hankyongi]KAA9040692.1 SET domain-containing protein [Ginsengibacter hankyongi]